MFKAFTQGWHHLQASIFCSGPDCTSCGTYVSYIAILRVIGEEGCGLSTK